MLLSFVVPCFNEEDNVERLCERLTQAAAMVEAECEFVLVDDGSTDATWQKITQAGADAPRIRGLRLSANWGHQAALMAGLETARGDRVLMLDADLQDPPELARDMMALMDQGYDVVYGTRRRRDGETWFKRASAKLYYRLMNRLVDRKIPQDAGDFRMVSRAVLDHVLALPERSRYLRGLFSFVGYRQIGLAYDREARVAGQSNYPLGKMIRPGVAGITAFSNRPLRLAMTLALLSILLSIALGIYVLLSLILHNTSPGWASLLITVSTFASIQLFCLGIIGEYVAKIFTEVKHRPLYFVAEDTGPNARSDSPDA